MFGHTDDQQQNDNSFDQAQQASGAVATNSQVFGDPSGSDLTGADSLVSQFSETPNSTMPSTGDDTSSLSSTSSSMLLPADDDSSTQSTSTISDDDSANDDDSSKTISITELLEIKQQALQQLSPLLSHLNQTPEDKFKTTMMMIQASDDQSLLQTAYKAAQDIVDKDAKAKALLDIVNEINYFTQNQ